jgi:hypothetical protein
LWASIWELIINFLAFKRVFVVESLEPEQRTACKNTAEHKEVPELSQQKSLYTPHSAINDSSQIQGCCKAFLE